MSYLGSYRSREYEMKDDYKSTYVRPRLSSRSTSPGRRVEFAESGKLYRDYEIARTEPSNIKYGTYDASREATFKSEIFDLESKIASRDAKIVDMERQIRTYQDTESSQAKTMKQMHDRIALLERDGADFSSVHSKAELTISTLHSDNRQLQERVLDLENRIRKSVDERDANSHERIEVERNYEDLKHYLSKTLWPESFEVRSHEILMKKVKDFAEDYQEMKNGNRKLEQSLMDAEDEVKRSRDTIRKLLDDVDRTKHYVSSTDVLKEERDSAKRHTEHASKEVQRMEERLLSAKEAWDKAQYELKEKDAKLGELHAVVKKHEISNSAYSHEFNSFRETLATLLSDGYHRMIASSEDAIKERVRHIMQHRNERNDMTRQLEDQLSEVSNQLEDQANLHKKAIMRAKKAEEQMEKYQDKLQGAEGELVATDILKKGLRMDKEKYLYFLEQMADVMKMDQIVKELGVELNGDALLARAEQLIKMEENNMGNRNIQSMGMQKQLRDHKRDLETKTMQLELTKKKLQSLEIQNSHRAEHDFEDIVDDNRKLTRQVEKLMKQLGEAKQTLQIMKKESVQNSALQLTCDEQRKHIKELERRLEDMDSLRSKQAKKIAGLKYDKDQIQYDTKHGYQVTESTIQSLSNEVKRLKKNLEEAQRREKQVLDLRVVIARMLGLDANTLAVPDYEIISRLEKLIESQHEMALAYRTGGGRLANANGTSSESRSYMLETEKRSRLRSGKPTSLGWK